MNFEIGQIVICTIESFPEVEVSEDFSVSSDAVYGPAATEHPKVWEALPIADIKNGFLTFEKYNTPEHINWWFHDRFTTPEGAKELLSWYIDKLVAEAQAAEPQPANQG